jgi:hypothetical protein
MFLATPSSAGGYERDGSMSPMPRMVYGLSRRISIRMPVQQPFTLQRDWSLSSDSSHCAVRLLSSVSRPPCWGTTRIQKSRRAGRRRGQPPSRRARRRSLRPVRWPARRQQAAPAGRSAAQGAACRPGGTATEWHWQCPVRHHDGSWCPARARTRRVRVVRTLKGKGRYPPFPCLESLSAGRGSSHSQRLAKPRGP